MGGRGKGGSAIALRLLLRRTDIPSRGSLPSKGDVGLPPIMGLQQGTGKAKDGASNTGRKFLGFGAQEVLLADI